MDPITIKLIALVVVLAFLGISLRRRYGNLYAALTRRLEGATGLSMTTILRALGLLTLAAWALVYLLHGGAEEEGLEQLFPEVPAAGGKKDSG